MNEHPDEIIIGQDKNGVPVAAEWPTHIGNHRMGKTSMLAVIAAEQQFAIIDARSEQIAANSAETARLMVITVRTFREAKALPWWAFLRWNRAMKQFEVLLTQIGNIQDESDRLELANQRDLSYGG